jgi:hypothetical protein
MNRKFDDPGKGADGLDSVSRLCTFYRNLMIEADFAGEAELQEKYRLEYERLCELMKRGASYEPRF